MQCREAVLSSTIRSAQKNKNVLLPLVKVNIDKSLAESRMNRINNADS
jgi:hypothetical protein